jgi:flavin reductase (DIM6/NTAB) family NADH-FMN oxidoreductase RutF
MSDEEKQLAAALGRIPSGLFIVTARRDGQETGMLASWIQQCSFAPPMLSLAIKQGRYLADWLVEGAAFTVNILERDQSDMIAHFGRGFAPGEPAFEGLDVRRPDSGGPILTEALAYLECRVACTYPAGDHVLLITTIERGKMLNEGQPLIHVRKNGLHY